MQTLNQNHPTPRRAAQPAAVTRSQGNNHEPNREENKQRRQSQRESNERRVSRALIGHVDCT